MERKFNVYLHAAKLQHGQTNKRKYSRSGKGKSEWLTFRVEQSLQRVFFISN